MYLSLNLVLPGRRHISIALTDAVLKLDSITVNSCVTHRKLKMAGLLNRELQCRMWADAQRDGRRAEYGWRALFNAAKFG